MRYTLHIVRYVGPKLSTIDDSGSREFDTFHKLTDAFDAIVGRTVLELSKSSHLVSPIVEAHTTGMLSDDTPSSRDAVVSNATCAIRITAQVNTTPRFERRLSR